TLDRVEAPLEGEAQQEGHQDDPGVGQRARAASEIQMPQTREEPGQRRGHVAVAARSVRHEAFAAKSGVSLRRVADSSSGTTRTSAATVMKLVSPVQRGTMCTW